MSPEFVLLFEFSPQPADTSCTGSGHPSEAGTKKGVFLFTCETKTAGFLVEMPEFLRELHALGKSRRKRRALASGDAGAMEAGDGVPADVPTRI